VQNPARRKKKKRGTPRKKGVAPLLANHSLKVAIGSRKEAKRENAAPALIKTTREKK